MNKIVKGTLVFLLTATLLAFALLYKSLPKKLSTERKETTLSSYQTKGKYRLAVYQNKLALFSGNAEKPTEIFDTYADMFPLEEQKKLRDGIYADTEEEIEKIIEDYTS